MKISNTILITDDNPENLKLLSNILKGGGYEVRVARNGQQAYDSALAEQPDLIMLDIQMPEMDGYEACTKIKKVNMLKDIPIIFISAMSEAFNKVLAFEAGGADYITKPFQIEEVLIRVGNQIKIADQQHQLEEVNMMLFEQFKSTFEQAAVGIAHIDPDSFQFRKVNTQLCYFLGYSQAELLSKSIADVTHPNFLETEISGCRRLGNGELDTHTSEKKYIKKDGTLIWVRVTISLVKFPDINISNYFLAIIEDISQRKISEELNAKLSKAVEQSPNSIIITNKEGIIEYVNPAFTTISGYTSKEAIGKNPHFLNSGHHKNEFFADMWKTIKEGDVWQNEILNKRKDNQPFWENTNISALVNTQGELTHFIAVKTDITNEKLLINDLIQAKAQAEESDKLKTAFLQNMSHEIRTPMNAILGFSQLLIRENISLNDKKSYSEYIRINGESLVKIIDDIIDISIIQSKQLTIRKCDFNLKLLLKELQSFYQSELNRKREKAIILKMEIPGAYDDEFLIHSDEFRLKQILNNLISNALKYTKQGEITFGYKVFKNEIQFYVTDTGDGIAAKNQEKIFERFFQHSDQYISKHEGTGLGLPISKELVFLLGGDLKVESEECKGSKFYFNLPLTQEKSLKLKDKDEKLDVEEYDFSKYKILIADDEDSNYVLTKRLLSETKIITDWAQNGLHAVEMASRTNYDLIIMDIRMPEMDGIEATRRIKKIHKTVPIIIQTAFAMNEAKEEAFKAGCDDFIVKPISLNAFLNLVNKHILEPNKTK